MNESQTDMKKRLTAIMRLERKIESTMSDVAKPGFDRNQFGSFDDVKVREKVLAAYRALVSDFPNEDYFRYLMAGALCRACQFEQGIGVYRALAAGSGPYSSPSSLLLAVAHWNAGDRDCAQGALDAYNASVVAAGGVPRHARIEQIVGQASAP
jgi:hypothetical protein